MLRSLTISNLAIIDALELEFRPGFTVLTGETGAGKSILVDAIGLVIGTRADTGLIRNGAAKAEIVAEFSLEDAPEALGWLRQQEMLDEAAPGNCVVRRVMSPEGRTRAFINGSPAATGALKELGELLIEVFGQNESQTLLRATAQRALLDNFGGYAAQLETVQNSASAWQRLNNEINRLRQAGPTDPAQLDFMRYQLQELQALNLSAESQEQLNLDHKRLANAGRLLSEGQQALSQLDTGEISAYALLATAGHTVASLAQLEPAFDEVDELVTSAGEQVREAAQALQRLLERLELDPEQLAEIEQRLAEIQDLARKHRVRPEALPQRQLELQTEVEQAEQASEGLLQRQQQLSQLEQQWRAAAEALTTLRREAAQRFSAAVTEIVRSLGMSNASFVATVDTATDMQPRAQGQDDIRFDFSANPGQPPRSLAKVASGGELSRLSLAIQVAASAQGGAATMIFDEVDAGIGGSVAEIVGIQLQRLGARRQVLSVTHLAQVASRGQQHLAISKEVVNGQTYTRVQPLDTAGRIAEIARMSGGTEVSESTQAHARELLQRAGEVR